MDAYRRTSTLRRVATTASLAALILIPAGQADAAKKKKPKSPVITAVSPMKATVGQTLTLKGRNFRKGKGRNSVGCKRDGSAVVFVKAGLSTTKTMIVKLPAKLEKVMYGKIATFHLRVLARRFGKSYTSDRLSPKITPRPVAPGEAPGSSVTPPPVAPPGPPTDCDDDGTPNSSDADDDNDLLSDDLENKIGTDGCKSDTDEDGVSNGYEYRAAIDLNDDEYQQPNTTLIYPGKLGYPNPVTKDAELDYDGDGLPLSAEYSLWLKTTPADQRRLTSQGDEATPLSYSDGLQYSVARRSAAADTTGDCAPGAIHEGRRVPTLTGANYAKYQDFSAWLTATGYRTVYLHDAGRWFNHGAGRFPYDIVDIDRSGQVEPSEPVNIDANFDGFLSDDERDEDADGLSNAVELRGSMTPKYWTDCYSSEPVYAITYVGTDLLNADTDGDGVRDGADDQDHDDVPNLMELSRMGASHLDDTDDGVKDTLTGGGRLCKADADLKPEEPRHPGAYGKVNPFNPCDPDPESRTCALYTDIKAEPGPDWWSMQ